MPVRLERYADLAATVLGTPARLGTYASSPWMGPLVRERPLSPRRLASAIRDAGANVATLHTDDLLDGWADIVTFWPRLEQWILGPLRRGEPARYRRYDWHRGRFGDEWHVLPVPEVLVLDGVSTARAARPVLSRSVSSRPTGGCGSPAGWSATARRCATVASVDGRRGPALRRGPHRRAR